MLIGLSDYYCFYWFDCRSLLVVVYGCLLFVFRRCCLVLVALWFPRCCFMFVVSGWRRSLLFVDLVSFVVLLIARCWCFLRVGVYHMLLFVVVCSW